jgi:hypothetical protein
MAFNSITIQGDQRPLGIGGYVFTANFMAGSSIIVQHGSRLYPNVSLKIGSVCPPLYGEGFRQKILISHLIHKNCRH